MISFSEMFQEPPSEPAPAGLEWDWRKATNGHAWCLVPKANPLAAMCNYLAKKSPESTAKEAPAGINTVAGFDHRPGAWN